MTPAQLGARLAADYHAADKALETVIQVMERSQ